MRKFVPTTLAAAIVVGLGTLTTVSSPLVASEPSEATVATVEIGQRFIDVEAGVNFESAVLRVAGPQGYALTRHVSVEDGPFITADLLLDAEPARFGGAAELQQRDFVPDGTYRYEIEFRTGDGSVKVSTGTFRVENGSAYELERATEEVNDDGSVSAVHEPGIIGRMAGSVIDFVFPSAHAADVDNLLQVLDQSNDGNTHIFLQATDTVPPSNWWIQNNQGSLMFREYFSGGNDYRVAIAPGGNFGIGTTTPQDQLHVNDTSGFQIRMTSSTTTTRLDSFGNQFAIYGNNGSNQFRISGDAPAGSQAINADGNVGFGTTAPAQKMHIVSQDAATRLRIDPTGSTWDLWAGFAGLWFVEEDGATTPFKLANGAPNDSLVVAGSGGIGLGTAFPSSAVHVLRNDNTANVRVEDSGSGSPQVMFQLLNNGFPQFNMQDTSQTNVNWSFRLSGSAGTSERFTITKVGTGAAEFELYHDGSASFRGDVTANGVLLTSTREAKTDFRELDAREVLDKLASLEISQWRYKHEDEDTVHFGPVAEEFHEVFGLSDGKRLNMIDTNGIAFAAIQALNSENRELRERLAALEQKLLD